MDIRIFSLLHVSSVMLLFTAFGAIILSNSDRHHKAAAILHGVSLLLLFISGFGMLGVLKMMGTHSFWIAKIVILILLGGALVVAKRRLLHPPAALAIVVGLGIAAAWLGIYKPF